MNNRKWTLLALAGVAALIAMVGAMRDSVAPSRRDLILATTTSTQDSGLLDELVPRFEQASGYRVKTIAVGTGEALAMARRGDADVVLAHAPARERALVAEGVCVGRRLVMHNDFVLACPPRDPLGLEGGDDISVALKLIAERGATFVSRADDSGTHTRELALWSQAGIDPAGQAWYREAGQGMGATLMIAAEKRAYTLTDRGTYLALRHNLDLELCVIGDPQLINIYSVMEVSPIRFPRVNNAAARAFGEFLVSAESQALIETFGIADYGGPLFYPDAGKREAELVAR